MPWWFPSRVRKCLAPEEERDRMSEEEARENMADIDKMMVPLTEELASLGNRKRLMKNSMENHLVNRRVVDAKRIAAQIMHVEEDISRVQARMNTYAASKKQLQTAIDQKNMTRLLNKTSAMRDTLRDTFDSTDLAAELGEMEMADREGRNVDNIMMRGRFADPEREARGAVESMDEDALWAMLGREPTATPTAVPTAAPSHAVENHTAEITQRAVPRASFSGEVTPDSTVDTTGMSNVGSARDALRQD